MRFFKLFYATAASMGLILSACSLTTNYPVDIRGYALKTQCEREAPSKIKVEMFATGLERVIVVSKNSQPLSLEHVRPNLDFETPSLTSTNIFVSTSIGWRNGRDMTKEEALAWRKAYGLSQEENKFLDQCYAKFKNDLKQAREAQ